MNITILPTPGSYSLSLSLCLALLTSIAGSGQAEAQPAAPEPSAVGKVSVGVGGFVGIPLGDYGKAIDFGAGALVDVSYGLQQQTDLTARAGFIYLQTDSDSVSLSQIPIWFGARRYVGARSGGLFLQGELGFNRMEASVAAGDFGVSGSDSDTNLGVNLGAGIAKGKISAMAGLFVTDLDHASDSMLLGGTVGTSF